MREHNSLLITENKLQNLIQYTVTRESPLYTPEAVMVVIVWW